MLQRSLFKSLLICCTISLTISLIHCSSYENQKTLKSDPSYENRAYKFGYEINDGYNNQQYFKEQADSNNVKTGSYGYLDAYGIYRKVEYIADDKGFRVNIKSNEPGLGEQKILKKLSSLSADNDYSQKAYEPQQYKQQIKYEEPQYKQPKYEEAQYEPQIKYEKPKYEEAQYETQIKYEKPKYEEAQYEKQIKYEKPKYEEAQYEPQIKYEKAKIQALNVVRDSDENCDLPQTYVTPVKSPYTSPVVKSQQISYKPQTQQPQAHNPYVYNIVGMKLSQLRKLPFKMVRTNNIDKHVLEYWEKQNQLEDQAATISENSQTENPKLAMPVKKKPLTLPTEKGERYIGSVYY